jgi:hypothetical protein
VIALIHHHLRRGGVTQVMFSHARILRDAGEEVVLYTGEAASIPPPEGVEVRVVPELGYSDTADPESIRKLVDIFSSLDEEALLHIHNHSLGKNPAVTAAVAELARRGRRMVLQIHDFAEDGRPENLKRLLQALPDPERTLYPCSPRIQYAVLQTRDLRILTDAGLPEDRVFLLPNIIETPGELPPPSDPPKRILYLSRCIRRKNIGEFLLWAKTFPNDFQFATSLIPENPAERPVFDRWAALAEKLNLPVQFGIGMEPGRTFRDVTGSADACITTSVGEGFGMSFLEPFLMDRPLFGRDLPDITQGFKRDGILLDGLYKWLPVPVVLLDDGFWPRALATVQSARTASGRTDPLNVSDLQNAWTREGHIDFGRLDEPAQETVLLSGFSPVIPTKTDPEIRQNNRKILKQTYGPDTALGKLFQVYARTNNTKASPDWLSPAAVRDAFSAPESMWLLRS